MVTEYAIKHVERFIDRSNHHERENEVEYYMEPTESIYTIAKQCGFIPHGKLTLPAIDTDEHQYLVFFERAL